MSRLQQGPLKGKVDYFVSQLILKLKSKFEIEKHPFLLHIYKQLFRSATSVKVNLSEAEVAISDKEFRRILAICLREANESKTWIKILEKDFTISDLEMVKQEATEIIKILKTIIGKLSK